MRIRPSVGFVLLGLLLLFIVLNLDSVDINFFWIRQTRMPLAFVIFFSAAMGAMAVLALKAFKTRKKTKTKE